MNEKLPVCPVCENPDSQLFLEGEDFFLTREKFAIVACSSCGFRYTNPRPNVEESSRYYQSDDYISHGTGKTGLIPALYGIARRFTLRSKFGLVKRYSTGNSILDVGCGTGEFLHYCSKQGLLCEGVEPSEKARSHAETTYGLNVKPDFLTGTGYSSKFDCITLWHVLEHMHRLDESLAKLTRMLNKDGVLIIALPNCDSYDARYYGKFWAAYDLPRHIFHFNKGSLIRLAEKQGLICEKILPQKLDAFYISILSEKYKTGSAGYFRSFFRALISNCKARNPQFGHSSEIYILKNKIS